MPYDCSRRKLNGAIGVQRDTLDPMVKHRVNRVQRDNISNRVVESIARNVPSVTFPMKAPHDAPYVRRDIIRQDKWVKPNVSCVRKASYKSHRHISAVNHALLQNNQEWIIVHDGDGDGDGGQ